jgi:hypothetical protein
MCLHHPFAISLTLDWSIPDGIPTPSSLGLPATMSIFYGAGEYSLTNLSLRQVGDNSPLFPAATPDGGSTSMLLVISITALLVIISKRVGRDS